MIEIDNCKVRFNEDRIADLLLELYENDNPSFLEILSKFLIPLTDCEDDIFPSLLYEEFSPLQQELLLEHIQYLKDENIPLIKNER